MPLDRPQMRCISDWNRFAHCIGSEQKENPAAMRTSPATLEIDEASNTGNICLRPLLVQSVQHRRGPFKEN